MNSYITISPSPTTTMNDDSFYTNNYYTPTSYCDTSQLDTITIIYYTQQWVIDCMQYNQYITIIAVESI